MLLLTLDREVEYWNKKQMILCVYKLVGIC